MATHQMLSSLRLSLQVIRYIHLLHVHACRGASWGVAGSGSGTAPVACTCLLHCKQTFDGALPCSVCLGQHARHAVAPPATITLVRSKVVR